MLIPQFTLRWLFGLTAVVAVVASVGALALRGHGWAIGVSVAVGAMVVSMVVYALMFAGLWLLSLLRPAITPKGRSPFAPPGSLGPEAETPVEAILVE